MKTFIFCLGYLLILISLLPLIRQDYWFFRVFEYPRLQKLALNAVLIIGFVSLYRPDTGHEMVFTVILALNLCYLVYQVFPFTTLAPKQVIKAIKHNPERSLDLFIGNVFQYNREAKAYLASIKKVDPDMIMLVETDSWWAEQATIFENDYPYRLLVPLENTYGMLLYSKLELVDAEVKFLVDDDIPSIHTCIKLRSGDLIRFHGLHPTPPVPGENPRSTERDKEILLVAKAAKKSELPVIVAGDLNDVAWSYTTLLFTKISGLIDPRRGRGFFNTFHAKHRFMRFPLDHIFCSTAFTLLDIRRMPNCGSDHFPMYISLQYEPRAAAVQEEPQPDAADLATAEEKIEKST
ncbi:endonuclease/exonuclease/phosphatase family protein [Flavihumibacter sp. R14]|nr:endonuclease/exonuclease/phosphatase family protein [Flavihumibacter soli]